MGILYQFGHAKRLSVQVRTQYAVYVAFMGCNYAHNDHTYNF